MQCSRYKCSFWLQVTVMHSMYAGYMEKAIRYSEKALVQVDRLNCEHNKIPDTSHVQIALL